MLCVKGVTKSVRQKTFWALQASVWSKNKGGGGAGGLPWILQCWKAPALMQKLQFLNNVCTVISCEIMHNKDP